jgi:hypothetical protein
VRDCRRAAGGGRDRKKLTTLFCGFKGRFIPGQTFQCTSSTFYILRKQTGGTEISSPNYFGGETQNMRNL